ncbi:MAG: putative LPS assembly protein LptD, partial [Bacteroidia bacterium]|nr:putative LPS assembly protein LptD [Bacteroidia bacterium]
MAQSDVNGQNKKTVNPLKPASPDTSSRNTPQTAHPPKDTTKTIDLDTLDTDDGDDGQALDKKVIYNARDSIRYETKGQKVYLFGDAFIEYESMSIKAEYITVDNEKNTIKSTGKKDSLGKYLGSPVFKIDGQESGADSMIYNVKTKKGKIYGIKTKEGELILLGSEVKKDSNDVVYMKDLKCIPCQFEDSRTIFRAKKAKIIPDDKIVTGPMYLENGGVPTPLGLPFGYFPNTKKRHSGILIPTFNSSEVLGYSLKDGGFYWGISDQTDMTIRGDIYTNGSWALRTLNNYNINYKYTGSLSLGYSEFRSGEREIP